MALEPVHQRHPAPAATHDSGHPSPPLPLVDARALFLDEGVPRRLASRGYGDDASMEGHESTRGAWIPTDWLGLGLDYGTVRLAAARPEWVEFAKRVAQAIRDQLGRSVVSVEHVGSSAVPGLATKPIIDLAVGLEGQVPPELVKSSLGRMGYQFRGDAGDQGGLVFVLDARPKHRVVHLHVVDHGGVQWRRYITFRDLLLSDASARERYERIKRELAERFPGDRKAYTGAKASIVHDLLQRT